MDVLNILKNELSPELIGKVASAVGIEPAVAQKAAGGALPALISGFATKARTGGWDGIETVLDSLPSMGNAVEAQSALVDPEQAARVTQAGNGILDNVFGSGLGGVTQWLSSQFGIGKDAGHGLLATLAPMALGFLKRASGGNLLGFLKQIDPNLGGMLPAGLGGVLGLSAAGAGAGARIPEVKTGLPVLRESSSGFPAWLWLVPLIAIAGWALWRFTSTPPTEATPHAPPVFTPTQPPGTPQAPAQAELSPPGGMEPGHKMKTLPGGTSIHFPPGSIEDSLIAFIEDKSKPVDTTTWFTFDRLEFDTGKATIRTSSMERVKTIAAILNAYPEVHLKIGGYTDNVGDDSMNMRLSHDRAAAVMQALVDLGIGADRLEAEGYGEQYPKASNDTEEGRQRNRRIDVRVTAK